MTVIEVTLLGVVISSVTASLTYVFSTKRLVDKDELHEALKMHQTMCRESLETMVKASEDADRFRNGRLFRLEETSATKDDIKRLEKSLDELKETTRNDIERLEKSLHDLKELTKTIIEHMLTNPARDL